MSRGTIIRPVSRRAVVIGGALVVHAALAARSEAKKAKSPEAAKSTAAPAPPGGGLPAPVRDMLDLIRSAIRSGEIEDLKPALQWNELPPVIADGDVGEAIPYWRKISTDGQGREILAILATLLDAEPALTSSGRDIENSRMYVWPAFADKPVKELTPPERVQLLRLVTFADAQRMGEANRYSGWRLSIAPDGTWHSFTKG
jgi:hypothetical protein